MISERLLVSSVAVLALVAAPAMGAVVTLESGNSIVKCDVESDAGFADWTVGGADYLTRHWFWYRVGDTGGEKPLNALDPVPTYFTLDTDGDGDDDLLQVTYTGQDLQVMVHNLLRGVDAGSDAAIGEVIILTNLGASPMPLRFFELNNADFSAAQDRVEIVGGGTARQWKDGELQMLEVVPTIAPQAYQADSPGVLLGLLQDSAPTTLSNRAAAGVADVAWAYEWDLTIPAGGGAMIGENRVLTIDELGQYVPEPATVAILCVGMAGVVMRRRRGV